VVEKETTKEEVNAALKKAAKCGWHCWIESRLRVHHGEGLSNIRQHELKLTNMLLEGLSELDNVTVYGPRDVERMVGVVSAVVKGVDPARVSALLDQEYGIATRPGLHCAPLAHKSIGTFETGTVRFSVGFFNTVEDIEETVGAMKHIVKEYG